jgi:hypothetical protein
VLLLGSLPLAAFPPSPYYTLYGVVRNQVGVTLAVENADIILMRDGREIARTPILKELRGDINYELSISVDQNQFGSRHYADRAIPALGVFSLVVEMNGVKYYPIEVSGTLRAGKGGERVRLDLNLGEDKDGDGLPDAWEEWQLHQAGRLPGANGWDLSLITRDGDFDGDGISNYDEYVAGTFAGDATERFELRIVERNGSAVRFEFFAITGKVYSIEESSNLKDWTVIPFATTADGPSTSVYRATQVNIVPAYIQVQGATSRFFRLSVR